MMVEIIECRFMTMSDIDDTRGRIREILGRRLVPHHGYGAGGKQHAACEKFVLMSTAGVGEYRLE